MAATSNVTSGRPYPVFVTETPNTTAFVANTTLVTATQVATVNLTFIPPMLSIPITTNIVIGY